MPIIQPASQSRKALLHAQPRDYASAIPLYALGWFLCDLLLVWRRHLGGAR